MSTFAICPFSSVFASPAESQNVGKEPQPPQKFQSMWEQVEKIEHYYIPIAKVADGLASGSNFPIQSNQKRLNPKLHTAIVFQQWNVFCDSILTPEHAILMDQAAGDRRREVHLIDVYGFLIDKQHLLRLNGRSLSEYPRLLCTREMTGTIELVTVCW